MTGRGLSVRGALEFFSQRIQLLHPSAATGPRTSGPSGPPRGRPGQTLERLRRLIQLIHRGLHARKSPRAAHQLAVLLRAASLAASFSASPGDPRRRRPLHRHLDVRDVRLPRVAVVGPLAPPPPPAASPRRPRSTSPSDSSPPCGISPLGLPSWPSSEGPPPSFAGARGGSSSTRPRPPSAARRRRARPGPGLHERVEDEERHVFPPCRSRRSASTWLPGRRIVEAQGLQRSALEA